MNGQRTRYDLMGPLLLINACNLASPTAAPPPTSTSVPVVSPVAPTVPATQVLTETPVPTATPFATATLGPTATALGPTGTPAPTADPLHTACDNPYWPLRQGAVWVSKSKNNVFTTTVTAVTGNVTQAQATLTEQTSAGDV